MSHSISLTHFFSSCALALLLVVLTGLPLSGQVTAPSVYTTSIMVQGEPAGEEFADWTAAGIVVVDADPVDNAGFLDIANIQIANDSDFVYIRATLHNATPTSLLNLFLAFDTDQNIATGFDVLTTGLVGSELGYQNDFPFAQYAGIFNLNFSLTGGPFNNGGALIYPFWTDLGPPSGTEIEWAVPLDSVIQYSSGLGGPSPGIPNASFNFMVYTDDTEGGVGDITQAISYTLATPPAGTPGDFNGDGSVDGRDFLAWQRGESPNSLSAGDLADWQNNYGPGPLAAVSAVPEPSCLLLLGSVLATCVLRRRS